MRVLLVQNCPGESFGRYEAWLATSEHSYQIAHPYRDDCLPDLERVDAIVIGGTPICALDAHKHAFLETESRYLARAIERGIPRLGICFGGQLLALLSRGQVHRRGRIEIGGYEVELTAAGTGDPLFDSCPESFPVFHWHSDTFEPPSAAQLLATGLDGTPQAFRVGNSVGLQFHLEVAADEAARWARQYEAELASAGKTQDDVVEECRLRDAEMDRLAVKLIDNFLRVAGSA